VPGLEARIFDLQGTVASKGLTLVNPVFKISSTRVGTQKKNVRMPPKSRHSIKYCCSRGLQGVSSELFHGCLNSVAVSYNTYKPIVKAAMTKVTLFWMREAV
jgi:hypothetical protein